MSNVQVIKPEEPQGRALVLTPAEMLSRAIESGAGLEMVTKLMDLQDRWEVSQARKAFDAAIAAAKAEIPVVAKNAEGHNRMRYANFAAYARVVDPILSKHGLSYRFRTTQDDKINVACILRHRDGHAEENSLSGPADTSGAKNAIQSIGSTLSYLQRYTLIQALGLASSDDDDGHAAGGDTISAEDAEAIHNMLAASGADVARFLKFIGAASVEAIRAKDYDRAVSALQRKAAGK